MLKIVLSVSLISLASPAVASQCPALWQQINEKMQSAHPSVDQPKLMELRKQGEDFHHAGDHAKSEQALKEALALLDGH
jgi:hypothetical protein